MIRPHPLLAMLLGVCLSLRGNPTEETSHAAPQHEAEAPAAPVDHGHEAEKSPAPAVKTEHSTPAKHVASAEQGEHETRVVAPSHDAVAQTGPVVPKEPAPAHSAPEYIQPAHEAQAAEPATDPVTPAATHATKSVDHGNAAADAHAPATSHTSVQLEAPQEHAEEPVADAVGKEEVKSLLRIGETKTAQGDYESAEIAYRQVLAARATPEQDREALMGMARMYRRRSQMTRAAAIYEKIIKEYPSDSQLPVVYLELGRTQRALGAYRLAISRFYSVINSTLKLPEESTEQYRQLARTAQFEVAETYFVAGNYEEAAQFFSRLKLLDLTPADQARAHFKSAYAYNMGGEYEKAVASLRAFLELHPDDENTPEARYLLSISLRRLDRNKESLAVALELLKTERGRTAEDPKRWAYWQRKTGNQLANEFYEQGDATSALSIYLSLVSLSVEPIWRLPVLYQVALCYERMRTEGKAREYYGMVITEAKIQAALPSARTELADLSSMASWRLKHLDWETSTDRQLNTFFQTPDSPQAPTVAVAEPSLPKT